MEGLRAEQVKDLIGRQIHSSFRPEYVGKATETEGMGLIVSSYFKWNGRLILDTLQEALTDANFHTLNAEISELREKHKI